MATRSHNCLCSFQNVNRLYSKRPSADQSVNWSIQPVTNVVANAGSTQLSGKASQVSNGTYQVKVQINGGSIYTTSLDSNGHFQFANLPTFQGGETVSLWVQGLSNRTGLPLLTSSTVSQTVAYSVPQLTVTQIIERKMHKGSGKRKLCRKWSNHSFYVNHTFNQSTSNVDESTITSNGA